MLNFKRKLHLSVLLILISTLSIFSQSHECGLESQTTSNSTSSPSNTTSYSGSIDPAYLATFPEVSFEIFFWIIRRSDGSSTDVVTYDSVLENLSQANSLFAPAKMCFVLKGYDYIDNDSLYNNPVSLGTITNYATSNGYYHANAINVYVTDDLVQGNGVTNYGSDKMAIEAKHFLGFWEVVPGNVLAHELGHDFLLLHTFGSSAQGNTNEHVTRDPNDPDYNALTAGDRLHDTPAMRAFWQEIPANGSIYDIIDTNNCAYIGGGTDQLGVPFAISSFELGNPMAYTWSPCIQGFSIGQMIRMREYIQDFPNNLSVQAMVNYNPGVDLYVKDTPNDFGVEPNTVSSTLWNSKDIWIRNQSDFVEVHQNPEFDPNLPNYAYVKVTNRGCSASSGTDVLKLYWSKASTSLTWDYYWTGNNFPNNGPLLGNQIGTVTIPVLESNEDVVLEIPWYNIPNPADYDAINAEPWHFCLLARIESIDDPMTLTETTGLAYNVKQNNNIAWKNVTVVDLDPNTSGMPTGGVVSVSNFLTGFHSTNLIFKSEETEKGTKIFEEAEVTVQMDEQLYAAWEKGGRRLTGLKEKKDRKFIITGEGATIRDLVLEGNEIGTLNLEFNFLTKEVSAKDSFTYHVIQTDTGGGKIIGGETYEVHKTQRNLFSANIEGNTKVDKNEELVLNATSINEPAVYNWYNNKGDLLYQGLNFSTLVSEEQTILLEVIATNDGFKDYATAAVEFNPNAIENITPNPTKDNIVVYYTINKGSTAYLLITEVGTGITKPNHNLDIDDDQTLVNMTSYKNGYYVVTLVVDGNKIDDRMILKE